MMPDFDLVHCRWTNAGTCRSSRQWCKCKRPSLAWKSIDALINKCSPFSTLSDSGARSLDVHARRWRLTTNAHMWSPYYSKPIPAVHVVIPRFVLALKLLPLKCNDLSKQFNIILSEISTNDMIIWLSMSVYKYRKITICSMQHIHYIDIRILIDNLWHTYSLHRNTNYQWTYIVHTSIYGHDPTKMW